MQKKISNGELFQKKRRRIDGIKILKILNYIFSYGSRYSQKVQGQKEDRTSEKGWNNAARTMFQDHEKNFGTIHELTNAPPDVAIRQFWRGDAVKVSKDLQKNFSVEHKNQRDKILNQKFVQQK